MPWGIRQMSLASGEILGKCVGEESKEGVVWWKCSVNDRKRIKNQVLGGNLSQSGTLMKNILCYMQMQTSRRQRLQKMDTWEGHRWNGIFNDRDNGLIGKGTNSITWCKILEVLIWESKMRMTGHENMMK